MRGKIIMDQGKLLLLADKTMDVVLFLALLALIVMTILELRKRWNADRRRRLHNRQLRGIMLYTIKRARKK